MENPPIMCYNMDSKLYVKNDEERVKKWETYLTF